MEIFSFILLQKCIIRKNFKKFYLMKKIIECKFILLALFSLVCSMYTQAQSLNLAKFEGYYQLTNDTLTYLQITSRGNNLIVHQLWDDKEISFERKSELEFLNEQYSFPLKFSSDQNGIITQVVAFDRDLWN